MTGTAKCLDSVYLSGWEFNRLLNDDAAPLAARNSALPGAVFWHGGAPLWIFKNVYCTAESLENEREASSRVGWTTGTAFVDLANDKDGFFKPVDWTGLPEPVRTEAVAQWHELKRSPDVAERVRRYIRENNSEELEGFKEKLLAPVVSSLSAVLLSLRNLHEWIPESVLTTSADGSTERRAVPRAVKALGAFALDGIRNGTCLIPSPGMVGSKDDRDRLANVKNLVEAEMIPDLVAGDGAYTTANGGFVPYLTKLEPYRESTYGPIDAPMELYWRTVGFPRLKELRKAAEDTGFWDDLHRTWFPRLFDGGGDAACIREFEQWLRSALSLRRFAALLHLSTAWLMGTVAVVAASAAVGAGVPPPIAALAGTHAGQVACSMQERLRGKYGRVCLFKERAQAILTAPRVDKK